MKTWKVVGIGCGILALIGIVVLILCVVFVVHVSKNVEGVLVNVNSPGEVQVGQTFDLEVIVKNERAGKAFRLSDIDLADQYLAGFTLVAVKPPEKSNMHVPIANNRSFTFDVPIPAATSRTFVFTLKAEKEGIYRGDLSVGEGLQTITTMAQTVVKAKE
jgi:hypothetical protein